MKVVWSDFASEMLKDIFVYYKDVAGINVARNIKKSILSSTRNLCEHPDACPIEFFLSELDEGHRYMIDGNYKIVYKRVKEGVLITDIFHTRQDPKKINDKNRNPEGNTASF